MKCLITQSNYIPWKGYFDNIAQADVFVIYDDMQYTKRDWRNRNKVKSPSGGKWMTIPLEVKGKYFQKINETQISDPDWNKSHLDILNSYYAKASSYSEIKPWLTDLYLGCEHLIITDINRYFIEKINEYLGIEVKIMDSREFELVEGKTEKLVGICEQLGANHYITGGAAKNYIGEPLFSEKEIKIEYSDYEGYNEYRQLYPPFEHGVSILDLILNEGKKTINFIKYS